MVDKILTLLGLYKGDLSRGYFLKIEQQLNFWLSKDSLHIYFDDHEQPSKSAVQNNSVC